MNLVERLLAQDEALNLIEGLNITDNDRTAKQAADRIRELEALIRRCMDSMERYSFLFYDCQRAVPYTPSRSDASAQSEASQTEGGADAKI